MNWFQFLMVKFDGCLDLCNFKVALNQLVEAIQLHMFLTLDIFQMQLTVTLHVQLRNCHCDI